MKRIFIAAIALLLFMCAGCAKQPALPAPGTPGTLTITFDFERQSGYSTNQYAVWIEDMDGVVVRTLFATKFTAAGGYEKRPNSLTTWVERAVRTGITDADAVAGATPKSGPVSYVWDCRDERGNAVPAGAYIFHVEFTYRVSEGSSAGRSAWGKIEIGGGNATARAWESPADTPPASDMVTNVRADYTA